jgi:hypothetical protein
MDIKQAITATLAHSDAICDAYLADLTPAELFARCVPGVNHIAWQVGHLIASEYHLAATAAPGTPNPMPAGFAERHKKPAATCDDTAAFCSKEEYRAIGKQVRAATLKTVEGMSAADFDRPVTGVPPFCKTAGGRCFERWVADAQCPRRWRMPFQISVSPSVAAQRAI